MMIIFRFARYIKAVFDTQDEDIAAMIADPIHNFPNASALLADRRLDRKTIAEQAAEIARLKELLAKATRPRPRNPR